MSNGPAEHRSRRAILAAAAGGAAAIAASAALPLTAAALDDDPMLVGNPHDATSETSITQATDAVVAFRATNTLTGAAALVGSAGDLTDISPDTSWTGVYGFSQTSTDPTIFATGVWGDSFDVGVLGTGTVGVRAEGGVGLVAAGAPLGGTGVIAWGGDGLGADVALDVRGKLKLSRSGRSSIPAGKSSLKVTLPGMNTGCRVFAVLYTSRPGRWVRAVTPTTGSFTIYLNTTVTSSTYVSWFVLN